MVLLVISLKCAHINDSNVLGRKKGWLLSLDPTNLDRSYLFGRLLALAEDAEHSACVRGSSRPLRTKRLRPFFLHRPNDTWESIYRSLPNTFIHLSPGMSALYYYMMQDITSALPYPGDPMLNLPLDKDSHLRGYLDQCAALHAKTPVLHGIVRSNL